MADDDELVLLTWRFAGMIGIIDPDSGYSRAEQVAADRAKWPHLIELRDGDPVFDFDKCAEWMAELSGEHVEFCRKIVFDEWGDDEDQQRYLENLKARGQD